MDDAGIARGHVGGHCLRHHIGACRRQGAQTADAAACQPRRGWAEGEAPEACCSDSTAEDSTRVGGSKSAQPAPLLLPLLLLLLLAVMATLPHQTCQ